MKIALTFDAEHPDRPHCPPWVAAQILEVLRRSEVRASFFLQGRWVEAYPHLARDIAQGGHRIGSHSFYHVRMSLLSDDGIASDVLNAAQVIERITGVDPRPWFRCPWGECGHDARVLRVLDELGYRHVGWDVELDEWDVARTPREVEDAAVNGALASGDGAIVLLHTWPASVPAALPGIIDRLRAAGADFVTLDDLSRLAAPAGAIMAGGTESAEGKGPGHP